MKHSSWFPDCTCRITWCVSFSVCMNSWTFYYCVCPRSCNTVQKPDIIPDQSDNSNLSRAGLRTWLMQNAVSDWSGIYIRFLNRVARSWKNAVKVLSFRHRDKVIIHRDVSRTLSEYRYAGSPLLLPSSFSWRWGSALGWTYIHELYALVRASS